MKNEFILTYGQSGQEVLRLQKQLKKYKEIESCNNLILDGIWGLKTDTAIKDFKKVIGVNFQNILKIPIYIGLDLSHHNGNLNWDQIEKNKPKFIYLKSSEGRTHKDSKFESYVNEIKKINQNSKKEEQILFGFYHFARPDIDLTQDDPEKEAQYFFELTKNLGAQLRPALDLEKGVKNKNSLSNLEWAIQFSKEYKKLTNSNQNLILYSAKWYFDSYVKNPSSNEIKNLIQEFPDIWLASYNKGAEPERKILHWNEWLIWQNTGTGTWPGIKSNVDINYLAGGCLDDLTLRV